MQSSCQCSCSVMEALYAEGRWPVVQVFNAWSGKPEMIEKRRRLWPRSGITSLHS